MGPDSRALILGYRGQLPRIAPDVFVAPGAVIIGDVEIGAGASVWFGCVVRGDVHFVRIGARTNVQDRSVIHVTHTGIPTLIGEDVMIGHGCLIHACRLDDRCFVGMGAVVMDEARVETGAMVAAGALVTPGKRVPSGQLWAGRPARHLRDVTPVERAEWPELIEHYAGLAAEYRAALSV